LRKASTVARVGEAAVKFFGSGGGNLDADGAEGAAGAEGISGLLPGSCAKAGMELVAAASTSTARVF
jgi:hypothetical protein